jgi:hypothetical protein
MKKIVISAWAFFLIIPAIHAASDSKRGEDRYILTRNAPVLVSVDYGWQKDGLTPVRIDIPGLHLDFWMDAESRVFDDALRGSRKNQQIQALGHELFRLDTANGRLEAGGKILNGRIYERNALRIRLRLSNPAMALLLDIKKDRSALDLDGIIVPARVRAGKETSGLRELEIGSRGDRGEGRLFWDAGQGRLFYEAGNGLTDPEKPQAGRVCWAEKQR